MERGGGVAPKRLSNFPVVKDAAKEEWGGTRFMPRLVNSYDLAEPTPPIFAPFQVPAFRASQFAVSFRRERR